MEAGGKSYSSHAGVLLRSGVFSWSYQEMEDYTIEGNVICVTSSNGKVRFFTVNAISDSQMDITINTAEEEKEEGEEKEEKGTAAVFVKVTKDFSRDIVGMWEGVEVTGEETYGGAEARNEYMEDGSYRYYEKNDGEWMLSKDFGNEYYVDGDWLATRWSFSFGEDNTCEWWDLEYIEGENMKWSALREKEDGTRFYTTFTWKRTSAACPSRISAGSWTYVNSSTGYRGTLTIEDNDGGQSGHFELMRPSGIKDYDVENVFTYNAATGKGVIKATEPEGRDIDITAYPESDKVLTVSISEVFDGEKEIVFEGMFNKVID